MHTNNLIKFLAEIIFQITRLLPKKNWVIIQTFPAWEENGVVLYKKLICTSVEKIIWLVPEQPNHIPFPVDSAKTIFIKRRSLKGIFFYIFSKYVFVTHGLYSRKFPRNQISVNLWHGMPIKKVGLENKGVGLYTTYTLSTATYFKDILSRSFGVSPSSVLNIGLPRNENLLTPNLKVFEELNVPEGTKLLLWLPTYRKSVTGEIRTDGTDYRNPFNLPTFDQESFNNILIEKDIICFFKPHPMAELYDIRPSSNFKVIDDNFLYKKNLTLYQVLSCASFLISDISSVVVDYLLLDKPVIFSFADEESYLGSRGLNSLDIIRQPAGRICKNQLEIMEEIESLSEGKDQFRRNRNNLKRSFHGETQAKHCSNNLLKVIGLA